VKRKNAANFVVIGWFSLHECLSLF
jgi:hypothetical protein